MTAPRNESCVVPLPLGGDADVRDAVVDHRGTGDHRVRVGVHLRRPQQLAGAAVDGEHLGADRARAEDPAVAEDQLVAVDGRAGPGQVARHPGIAGDVVRPQHPPAAGRDRPQLAAVVRDVDRAVVHGRGRGDRAGRGQRPPRRQPAHVGRGDRHAQRPGSGCHRCSARPSTTARAFSPARAGRGPGRPRRCQQPCHGGYHRGDPATARCQHSSPRHADSDSLSGIPPIRPSVRTMPRGEGGKRGFLRFATFDSFAIGPVSCRQLIPAIQAR